MNKIIKVILILFFLTGNLFATTVNCPDGSIYKGDIVDNLFQGYGEQIWANGDYYRGTYSKGQFDGKGILKNGPYLYEGTFENGCYNGTGILTSEFGYKYIGDFKNNLFDGMGFLQYSSGESWKGDFSKGNFNGMCIHTMTNGKKETQYYQNGIQLDPYKPLKKFGIIFLVISLGISIFFNFRNLFHKK